MYNQHLHTEFSHDCNEKLENHIKEAIKLGFKCICVTDHYDPGIPYYGDKLYDYNKAYQTYKELKDRYRNKLELLFGVEFTYTPENENLIKEHLSITDYDYTLAGIHYCGGVHVLSQKRAEAFFTDASDDFYYQYFDYLKSAVKSGIFDAMAHIDVVRRYGEQYFGKLSLEKFGNVVTEILQLIIVNEIALEINTSGVRHQIKDIYPTRDILEMYYRLGGRNITIGTDAHKADCFFTGYEQGLRIAREIGFTHITLFKGRKPEKIKIV